MESSSSEDDAVVPGKYLTFYKDSESMHILRVCVCVCVCAHAHVCVCLLASYCRCAF